MGKPGNAGGFVATFVLEKETPGTFRFQESGDKNSHKIGSLYVKKAVFGNQPPEKLLVRVEVIQK